MPIELQRHHLDRVARDAADPWARDFARSILAQARQPSWEPSPKQRGVIRRLIADLHRQNDDVIVVEAGDG